MDAIAFVLHLHHLLRPEAGFALQHFRQRVEELHDLLHQRGVIRLDLRRWHQLAGRRLDLQALVLRLVEGAALHRRQIARVDRAVSTDSPGLHLHQRRRRASQTVHIVAIPLR